MLDKGEIVIETDPSEPDAVERFPDVLLLEAA